MSEAMIYLIRHLSFYYNDEYYSACLDAENHVGQIHGIFEDKTKAIAHWKQLEYQFSHKAEFDNIYGAEGVNRTDLPSKAEIVHLNPDELFEIIEQCQCHVYALYQYPAQLRQQVFFDPNQQHYQSSCLSISTDDIEENCFIHANFIPADPTLALVAPPIGEAISYRLSVSGHYEQLSDTPLLLAALVESDADFSRIGDRIEIAAAGLNKINALLKKPIRVEIQYLTLEEIYQQQLAQD